MTRLAVLSSHPIQYYAPLFRKLAEYTDLKVVYAHRSSPIEQARAGFGTAFEWDLDLTSGYEHVFLRNASANPGTDRFSGCDSPEIAQTLRAGSFDALLVMGWHLKSYVQGIIAAKRLGLPVLVRGDSHLATPRSLIKRLVKNAGYPALLRLFDAALYVGNQSKAYYEHYRFPADRLFFSPHCVDNAWFEKRATSHARQSLREEIGVAPDTPLVLFAGKLVPFKRPQDLIEAAAELRSFGSRVEVMIAGDGVLRGSLQVLAAQRGVPLHQIGFCNQTRMPAAYAAADLLVLPSDGSETWGLVANEALACRRKVIVSDACGCAGDLVVGDDAVLSFPLGNSQALAQTIQTALARPPTPDTFERVIERHSLEAAAKGILSALRTVVRS